ncbi:hypothetical protein KP78_07770 [Jeotgalibacillus soli]|uniref:HTH araC/xylS-type domain-containing protein n=2 Tax=Jeotgalibacillus soli TaxID=889306 RepID=A0A0C2S5I9_9BACL|nr:hypothetical protein KP78_07770 [Jeotgalibacillus soli]
MKSNEFAAMIERMKETHAKLIEPSHLVHFSYYKTDEEYSFFSEEPGILFVLSGEKEYQIGDDELRTLKQGEYLFFPKGVTVHIEVESGTSSLLVPLKKELTEHFVDLLRKYRNFSPELLEAPNRVCIMQEGWSESIEEALLKLLRSHADGNDYFSHLALSEILYYIFPNEHMLSKISYIMDNYYYPDPVRRVESYILENYHQPIRKEHIVEVARVSESHLNRLYNKYVLMSPMERLATIRMEQAALLLRNRSLTVTNAAGQVGYQSMSAFVNQFKKMFGVSPKDFQSNAGKK